MQQKLLVKSSHEYRVVRQTGDIAPEQGCKRKADVPPQGCKRKTYAPPHRGGVQQPQQGDIQIFVELPTSPRRTLVLMVKNYTSVREVKELVEKKSDGIFSASRMRLSFRGGKYLSSDELPINVSQGATLVCLPS